MRVPDQCVSDLRERGHLVLEGFLAPAELKAAQEALWLHYPSPEDYFSDPSAHASLGTSQFAGIIGGPWRSWDLNRLTFHPDLLDLAERFLGSEDIRLYEAELWAKYAEPWTTTRATTATSATTHWSSRRDPTSPCRCRA